MSEAMRDLVIRHQIYADADGLFRVRETFGDQRPVEFVAATLQRAEQIAESRRSFLLDMVASLSPAAKLAVEDARYVDNVKAGHA